MIALPSLQSFTFTRSTPFHVALVVLVIAFHLSTPRCTTVKQRAWVLTTISSAVMSVASLPLAWEYLVSCFDLLSVQKSNMWTYCASRFFQAYLIAFVSFHISHTFTSLTLYRDISLGLIYYRSKLNFLTGWVHHTVYVFIVEYAIRKNWSYIFCLCAVMEVRAFTCHGFVPAIARADGIHTDPNFRAGQCKPRSPSPLGRCLCNHVLPYAHRPSRRPRDIPHRAASRGY